MTSPEAIFHSLFRHFASTHGSCTTFFFVMLIQNFRTFITFAILISLRSPLCAINASHRPSQQSWPPDERTFILSSLVGGFVHAGVLHLSTLMRISEPRTRVITSLASFDHRASLPMRKRICDATHTAGAEGFLGYTVGFVSNRSLQLSSPRLHSISSTAVKLPAKIHKPKQFFLGFSRKN